MIARASYRLLCLPLTILLAAACAKGETSAVHDGSVWRTEGGAPDFRWPDRGQPLDGARDHRVVDARPTDTRTPDVLSADVLSPDVLSPDILAPDILAPDTMPQGTFTAPFSLDFEANSGGLATTKDWEWGKLSFKAGSGCSTNPNPPSAAHSGTRLWGTVLNDCHNPLGNADASCNNVDTKDDSTLSITIKLPAIWTTATLTYWQWFDVFTSFDWGEVRVGGAVARQFCSKTPPGSSGAWEKVTVNLGAHVGKTITVTFHFMATTVVNYAGWYIDDLAVSGA